LGAPGLGSRGGSGRHGRSRRVYSFSRPSGPAAPPPLPGRGSSRPLQRPYALPLCTISVWACPTALWLSSQVARWPSYWAPQAGRRGQRWRWGGRLLWPRRSAASGSGSPGATHVSPLPPPSLLWLLVRPQQPCGSRRRETDSCAPWGGGLPRLAPYSPHSVCTTSSPGATRPARARTDVFFARKPTEPGWTVGQKVSIHSPPAKWQAALTFHALRILDY